MSEEFDARKDSHSTQFERRPQIFVNQGFIKSCVLHLFGNMTIIH